MGQSQSQINKMMIAKSTFDNEGVYSTMPKSLKGTNFSISKQLPQETEEKHQFVWLEFKRAHGAKLPAKYVGGWLMVSGKAVDKYDPIQLTTESKMLYGGHMVQQSVPWARSSMSMGMSSWPGSLRCHPCRVYLKKLTHCSRTMCFSRQHTWHTLSAFKMLTANCTRTLTLMTIIALGYTCYENCKNVAPWTWSTVRLTSLLTLEFLINGIKLSWEMSAPSGYSTKRWSTSSSQRHGLNNVRIYSTDSGEPQIGMDFRSMSDGCRSRFLCCMGPCLITVLLHGLIYTHTHTHCTSWLKVSAYKKCLSHLQCRGCAGIYYQYQHNEAWWLINTSMNWILTTSGKGTLPVSWYVASWTGSDLWFTEPYLSNPQ